MKRFILITLGCLTLTAGMLAAQEPARGGRAAFVEKVREKLNLTDDQLRAIKAELAAQKEAIADLLPKLHAAKTALRDVIQKDGATEAEVRAAAGKLAAVEADAAVLRSRLHARIKPLLTEDQLGKIKEVNASVDELITQVIAKVGAKLGRE